MLEKNPAPVETKPPAPVETMSNPSLLLRVQARKAELASSLAKLAPDDRSRRDLESALSQVDGMLTGDLEQIPNVVAAELSKWLESSKYLGDPRPEEPGST